MGQDRVVVRSWTDFPDLAILEFNTATRRYRELVDQENAIKVEKKSLAKDLEAALTVTGEKSVQMEDLVVVQANGRSASYISAQRLASAGVDAGIIAACTVAGTAYTYVQVKRKGEK